MSDVKDGGPAFACVGHDNEGHSHLQEGMSLRDWFAGQALHGLLAHPKTGCKADQQEALAAALSEVAFIIADAMLLARKGDSND